MTIARRAAIHGHASADINERLKLRGWQTENTPELPPLDLVIVTAAPPRDNTLASPEEAMLSVGTMIETLVHAGDRLRPSGGLALAVVQDPPERAAKAHRQGGVI